LEERYRSTPPHESLLPPVVRQPVALTSDYDLIREYRAESESTINRPVIGGPRVVFWEGGSNSYRSWIKPIELTVLDLSSGDRLFHSQSFQGAGIQFDDRYRPAISADGTKIAGISSEFPSMGREQQIVVMDVNQQAEISRFTINVPRRIRFIQSPQFVGSDNEYLLAGTSLWDWQTQQVAVDLTQTLPGESCPGANPYHSFRSVAQGFIMRSKGEFGRCIEIVDLENRQIVAKDESVTFFRMGWSTGHARSTGLWIADRSQLLIRHMDQFPSTRGKWEKRTYGANPAVEELAIPIFARGPSFDGQSLRFIGPYESVYSITDGSSSLKQDLLPHALGTDRMGGTRTQSDDGRYVVSTGIGAREGVLRIYRRR
jgi:hypothetical protein